MKTSITFLKSKDDFNKTIEKIAATSTDFIHVDVADGIFVNNKTSFTKEMLGTLKNCPKEKDVHLMTLDLKNEIDKWMQINPKLITFQYEATTHPKEIITYIKEKKCKVGLAISPLTNLEEVISYLSQIDLVLIMAIIPGYGGQKFLETTPFRAKQLKELKEHYNYSYLISVDGGINDKTIKKFAPNTLDIAVSGSFVCCSDDYEEKINQLNLNKSVERNEKIA